MRGHGPELVIRFRRAVRIAYSRRPAARLFRAWRYFSTDPTSGSQYSAADILLLPLAGLTLTLLLLGTVPGASEAINTACETACMP
jgi:hypothetical protein